MMPVDFHCNLLLLSNKNYYGGNKRKLPNPSASKYQKYNSERELPIGL